MGFFRRRSKAAPRSSSAVSCTNDAPHQEQSRRRSSSELAGIEYPGDSRGGATPDVATALVGDRPGSIVRIEPIDTAPDNDRWIWRSTDALPASLWPTFVSAFPASALWPLLTTGGEPLEGAWDGDAGVALDAGATVLSRRIAREVDPETGYDNDFQALLSLDGHSPEDILGCLNARQEGAPAAGAIGTTVAVAEAEAAAMGEATAVALVPVVRPADTFAWIGWLGACNVDLDADELTAVARRWEDNYGAHLVGLTSDTAYFAVSRPPRDLVSARALAAEHWAICGDGLSQDVGDPHDHAAALIGATAWRLWWD